MDKKHQLAINTFLIFIGRASTQLLSLLLLPLYTFYLSPTEYGIADLITTYVVLLAPIITLQLDMGIFRYLVDARKSTKKKIAIISSASSVIIALSLITALLGCAIAAWLNIPYGYVAIAAIITTVWLNMILQIARGLGKTIHYAIAGVIVSSVTIITSVVFIAALQMGVYGLLLAVVIANTIAILYLALLLKIHRLLSSQSVDRNLVKTMLHYSLPLIPSVTSWWVISAFDRTLISSILGLSANGLYAIASKFAIIPTGLIYIFHLSWSESASLHIKSRDRDIFFSEIANNNLRFFGYLGVVMLLAIPAIFPILIGNRYNNAYWVIPPLIVAACVNSIVSFYNAICVAQKDTGAIARTALAAAGINIIIAWLFIYTLGIVAAGIASLISYILMALYLHWHITKKISITYNSDVIQNVALALVAAIALYYANNPLVNWSSLICAACIGATSLKQSVSYLRQSKKKPIHR